MPHELILVGGGHAHIEVIRRFAADPVPETRLRVIDPNPRPVYSGMVPGFVAGQYSRPELEVDLKALCESADATYLEAHVCCVHADDKRVELEDGSVHSYDLASLDIGSTVSGLERPGVREHALASRPITDLLSAVDALVARAGNGAPLHVVGAGAGGIELAFCLEARLRARASVDVALVSSDSSVLANATSALRSRVEGALARRGIQTLCNSNVTAILEDALVLEEGFEVPSSGAIWVTGPASQPLATDSKLPIDSRGFLRIEPTLQVEQHRELFAVGDCASLAGMKKAGVYAVRSGPLLDFNLRARLAGETLREYAPQHDFLSLLNLGDGTAIAAKWGLALEGRAWMWLKDRIDRSFMARYALR